MYCVSGLPRGLRDHCEDAQQASTTVRAWFYPLYKAVPFSCLPHSPDTSTPFCRGQSMPCRLDGSQVGHGTSLSLKFVRRLSTDV